MTGKVDEGPLMGEAGEGDLGDDADNLRTTCACGYVFVYTGEESGERRVCPECGRDNVLKNVFEFKGAETQIRCPHCGEMIQRLYGLCPHCGKNVAVTTSKIVAFVVAGVIALALVIMGLVGFASTTREDALKTAVERYHYAFRDGLWEDVYELKLEKLAAGSVGYDKLMSTEFSGVEVVDFSVTEWKIDKNNDTADVTAVFSATIQPGNVKINRQLKEKWFFRVPESRPKAGMGRGRRWLIGRDDEAMNFVSMQKKKTARKASEPKILECPLCHGTGRVECLMCRGKGLLEDGSFCPDCVKSQGWKVCPKCRGTGFIIIKPK